MLSKDEPKVRNAIKHIGTLDTVEAVNAYIEGDDRQDVLDAAEVQVEFIEKPGQTKDDENRQGATNPDGDQSQKSKQGETGPITQKTDEFKGPGVQGTKDADGKSTENRQDDAGATKDSKIPHSALRTPHSAVSGQDIVGALDAAAGKQAQDLERQALESVKKNEGKSEAVIRKEKGIVTCEDVLEMHRREGKTV